MLISDLKPGNIFFFSDSYLKIGANGWVPEQPCITDMWCPGDFGLCVQQHPTATEPSTALVPAKGEGKRTTGVGTPSYASPEQLERSAYTNAADIFSLGMILFEMLHPIFSTAMERATIFSEVMFRWHALDGFTVCLLRFGRVPFQQGGNRCIRSKQHCWSGCYLLSLRSVRLQRTYFSLHWSFFRWL